MIIVLDTDNGEVMQKLADLIAGKMKPDNKTEQIPEWIDQSQACKILGGGQKSITRQTLYQYRNDGKIKFKLLGKKRYLYNTASINKFLNS